jgi:hypothetical protein
MLSVIEGQFHCMKSESSQHHSMKARPWLSWECSAQQQDGGRSRLASHVVSSRFVRVTKCRNDGIAMGGITKRRPSDYRGSRTSGLCCIPKRTPCFGNSAGSKKKNPVRWDKKDWLVLGMLPRPILNDGWQSRLPARCLLLQLNGRAETTAFLCGTSVGAMHNGQGLGSRRNCNTISSIL